MINEGQVTLLWERLFQQETITPEGLQRTVTTGKSAPFPPGEGIERDSPTSAA
jgi:hypothetical protein